MTRMLILACAAVTTIAAFVSYLAGYHAGAREQVRQTLEDIAVLRRAEDDRVQVDVRVAETYDEQLAAVLEDLRASR